MYAVILIAIDSEVRRTASPPPKIPEADSEIGKVAPKLFNIYKAL